MSTSDAVPDAGHRAWLSWLAVAVTLALWASAFVGIRHLGGHFDPGPMALGRLAVGGIALGAVLAWTGMRGRGLTRPTREQWIRLIVIGVLWHAIYNVALNAGELLVDAGTAALLLQTSPILITVMAATLLGERFTVRLGIGLALAFGGVALIAFARPGGSPAHGADGNPVIGVLLCLVAALVYSISTIVQKPLMTSGMSAVQVTWTACTIGAVTCLVFAPELVRQVAAAPVSATGWLIYLGIFPTAIAFSTFAYALTHMPASSLGITTYVVPPITVALGWWLLGEVPPGLAYAGGALALLGVAIARGRGRSRNTARRTPTQPA